MCTLKNILRDTRRGIAGVVLAGVLAPAMGGPAPAPAGADDVVARVGDEAITFSQLTTMINSSAVVGLSVPPLGSPERHTARLTLLDKMISANLLYLDARRKGLHRDSTYRRDRRRFADALLASLYRSDLVGEIEVSAKAVQAFHEASIGEGVEMTDELRAAIEARLRKEALKSRMSEIRARLREGVAVEIRADELDPGQDAFRGDDAVLATVDDRPVTWGEARGMLSMPANARSTAARRAALDGLVDSVLMARRARETGLEDDPVYRARMAEFTKTHLINMHRRHLAESMAPTEAELEAWYAANRADVVVPEHREVQMVVVETEGEARRIKEEIASGGKTMHEAALAYSIDPNVERTLGKTGWVAEGSGFPALDRVTFALEGDEIGGPVESPAGWHLVRVVDRRAARYTDLKDEQTHAEMRRRMVHERLDDYLVDLRRNHFTVSVDVERLDDLYRDEARWIQAKTAEAAEHPELRRELMEKMQDLGTVP